MDEFSPQDFTVFAHDGTERPIQRPADNAEQKKYYSGKQERHTVKNNVSANAICKVVYLTPTVEGKKHDKKLADESDYKLPEGSALLQDTDFQGFTVEGVSIVEANGSSKSFPGEACFGDNPLFPPKPKPGSFTSPVIAFTIK